MPLTNLFLCLQWCYNGILSALISISGIRKTRMGSGLGSEKAEGEHTIIWLLRSYSLLFPFCLANYKNYQPLYQIYLNKVSKSFFDEIQILNLKTFVCLYASNTRGFIKPRIFPHLFKLKNVPPRTGCIIY